MKVPVTARAIREADDRHPLEAALRAWTEPGPYPAVHRRAQDDVRAAMPLLARALDRAADR